MLQSCNLVLAANRHCRVSAVSGSKISSVKQFGLTFCAPLRISLLCLCCRNATWWEVPATHIINLIAPNPFVLSGGTQYFRISIIPFLTCALLFFEHPLICAFFCVCYFVLEEQHD